MKTKRNPYKGYSQEALMEAYHNGVPDDDVDMLLRAIKRREIKSRQAKSQRKGIA